jgi:hypothetical protein
MKKIIILVLIGFIISTSLAMAASKYDVILKNPQMPQLKKDYAELDFSLKDYAAAVYPQDFIMKMANSGDLSTDSTTFIKEHPSEATMLLRSYLSIYVARNYPKITNIQLITWTGYIKKNGTGQARNSQQKQMELMYMRMSPLYGLYEKCTGPEAAKIIDDALEEWREDFK